VRKKPEISLRARALQYLARREYSRAELQSKLQKYVQLGDESFEEVSSPDLNALLDDLTERGWLSDERATAQLVHSKRNRFGTQRIAHELRQKGVSDELINATLPALKDSEFETARDVWQRKFASLPQDAKEKAKQMRFLQSRGFSMDAILAIFRHQ
jgi:regulatory protein